MSKTIKQEKEEAREGWHRHKKGNGWIKDTATVSDDVYVDEDAYVYGGVIRGGVIRGGVIWGGVIRGGVIRGGVIWGGVIWGGEIRISPIQIQGPKWFVIEVEPGKVQIGCTTLTIPEWRERGLALAKGNMMSEDHIAFYTAAIEFIERFGAKVEASEDAEPAEAMA